jgi:hypothetical protein
VEEQEVMLEQLLAAADILTANSACDIEESDESQGPDQGEGEASGEDFGLSRG